MTMATMMMEVVVAAMMALESRKRINKLGESHQHLKNHRRLNLQLNQNHHRNLVQIKLVAIEVGAENHKVACILIRAEQIMHVHQVADPHLLQDHQQGHRLGRIVQHHSHPRELHRAVPLESLHDHHRVHRQKYRSKILIKQI